MDLARSLYRELLGTRPNDAAAWAALGAAMNFEDVADQFVAEQSREPWACSADGCLDRREHTHRIHADGSVTIEYLDAHGEAVPAKEE